MGDPAPLRELSVRSGWVLSLCPAAAEGGGCFVTPPVSGGRGVPDPERSRQEAARRARGRSRRYCAANGLNRLGTLTYAPPFCTDPVQVRSDVGVFFRSLRSSLGGKPLPYVWVPELHKDGQRFHVHFAVGQYVRQSLIRDVWGRGHVHIKLLSDLPVGSGRIEEARAAAGYLAKYVGKNFPTASVLGRHRYDVAQGFQPVREQIWARSADEVIGLASQRFGWARSGADVILGRPRGMAGTPGGVVQWSA